MRVLVCMVRVVYRDRDKVGGNQQVFNEVSLDGDTRGRGPRASYRLHQSWHFSLAVRFVWAYRLCLIPRTDIRGKGQTRGS